MGTSVRYSCSRPLTPDRHRKPGTITGASRATFPDLGNLLGLRFGDSRPRGGRRLCLVDAAVMYTSFFELNKDPFNVAADPAFLFLSASHREALAGLQYGLLARK